jgi:hypothetical protein
MSWSTYGCASGCARFACAGAPTANSGTGTAADAGGTGARGAAGVSGFATPVDGFDPGGGGPFATIAGGNVSFAPGISRSRSPLKKASGLCSNM